MTRQDHWNRVGEGEGRRWVWELCDMVSVNNYQYTCTY